MGVSFSSLSAVLVQVLRLCLSHLQPISTLLCYKEERIIFYTEMHNGFLHSFIPLWLDNTTISSTMTYDQGTQKAHVSS